MGTWYYLVDYEAKAVMDLGKWGGFLWRQGADSLEMGKGMRITSIAENREPGDYDWGDEWRALIAEWFDGRDEVWMISEHWETMTHMKPWQEWGDHDDFDRCDEGWTMTGRGTVAV